MEIKYRTMTGREIAKAFNVSPQAVSNWVKKGLPHDRKGIRIMLFNAEEVQEWINKQREK